MKAKCEYCDVYTWCYYTAGYMAACRECADRKNLTMTWNNRQDYKEYEDDEDEEDD